MFIQLKAHKAHVYSQTEIDPSKKNIVLIPGAGMDHRTLSMFKLDSIKETHMLLHLIFQVMAIQLDHFLLMLRVIPTFA